MISTEWRLSLNLKFFLLNLLSLLSLRTDFTRMRGSEEYGSVKSAKRRSILTSGKMNPPAQRLAMLCNNDAAQKTEGACFKMSESQCTLCNAESTLKYDRNLVDGSSIFNPKLELLSLKTAIFEPFNR